MRRGNVLNLLLRHRCLKWDKYIYISKQIVLAKEFSGA